MRLSQKCLAIGSFILSLSLLFISVPAFAVQSVSSDTTLSADGSVNGVNFTADSILTAPAGTVINATPNANGVTTATNNTGSLGFAGGATVNGVVGTASTGLIRQITGGVANTQVIFTGNVFATTTTVNGTGSINFNSGADLTGTSVNFLQNGTVGLSDGSNITLSGAGSEPNITTSTNGTGSLAFLGASTVTGQIGSTSNRLGNIAAGASSGKIVTFNNDVYAVTTSVNGTGSVAFKGNLTGTTLNFAGNGRVDVANGVNLDVTQITTATDDTGSIVFAGSSTISPSGTSIGASGKALHNVDINGGIVTLDTDSTGYFVNSTNINSGGTFKVESAETITGNINAASGGTMDLGAVTTSLTGNFTAQSGSIVKTTITDATTAGKIVATGTSVGVSSGSIINVTVAGYVPNGAVYKIIDAAAGAPGAATSVLDSSPVLSFTASVTSTNDISITAVSSFTGVATNSNSLKVGDVLSGFTATGDMATAIGSIYSLTSASDVENALEQLQPDASGGINQAALNAAWAALGTVEGRLSNKRNGVNTGNGQMGISTGDDFRDLGLWAQGFGAYGDQDNRDGVAGYTAGTYGGATGIDWKMDDMTRLGMSFAYGKTNVDTRGGNSDTDIDTYQGTLYGGYDAEHYYIDGMFAFGWNDYDGSRHIQFGSLDRTADADYSGQQYTTKWTFGYKLPQSGFTVTPLASLMYSHLAIESYTETNAGGLSLMVDNQDYDFLQSGLGAKIEVPFYDKNQRMTWAPEFHALWLYEFIGDEAEMSSTFTGGGASFTTTGFSPEQSSLNAGAGITYYPTDGFSINLKYDFAYRSDYTGHAGTATAKWEF